MKRILFLIIITLIMGVNSIYAQFVYENREYSPLIKTVILQKSGGTLSDPIMYLNKNQYLNLEFDEVE
jgi:capsular polysaccharide biosynthesis protein